jgi:hypothetical protein
MMVNDPNASHLRGRHRQQPGKLGYPHLGAQLPIGGQGLTEHGAVLGPGLDVQVSCDGTAPPVTLLKASTDLQLASMIAYLDRRDPRLRGVDALDAHGIGDIRIEAKAAAPGHRRNQ